MGSNWDPTISFVAYSLSLRQAESGIVRSLWTLAIGSAHISPLFGVQTVDLNMAGVLVMMLVAFHDGACVL